MSIETNLLSDGANSHLLVNELPIFMYIMRHDHHLVKKKPYLSLQHVVKCIQVLKYCYVSLSSVNLSTGCLDMSMGWLDMPIG